MNILVTGGAGFIGSHIVDAYVEAGHKVIVLDNLSTGQIENINKNAHFVQMDIRDKKIESVFKEHQIEAVSHQAAQMDVRLSVEDPIFDADNNVIGMLNILQNCVKHKVEKIIFSSSGGAIYGEQDYFPADESHPLQPCSPYGITKLVGEKYLFFYSLNYGLKYTALRYANVYGPRQNPHGEAGVVAIFATKLLQGEQPIINGDGKQTRDFVFIKDVVKANVLALENKNDQIINVGTSIESTVNDIYAELNSSTGANKPEEHGPGKEGEQFRSVIAYDKAKKVMNWSPSFTLKEGISETVDFFKSRV